MNLDKLSAQIERMTNRLAQARTKKMLWETRQQTEARERARRLDTRRRFALGTAVVQAGFGDWEPADVVGVLLDGHERMNASPTVRLGLKKRGAEHLARSVAPRSTKRRPDPQTVEVSLLIDRNAKSASFTDAQTVKTKSMVGAPPSSNPSHGFERMPSVG